MTHHRHVPPIGVHLTQHIENSQGSVRCSRPMERSRFTPAANLLRHVRYRRRGQDVLEQLESRTHITSDPLISLADYVPEIGGRHLQGLDPSSTASGYRGSLRAYRVGLRPTRYPGRRPSLRSGRRPGPLARGDPSRQQRATKEPVGTWSLCDLRAHRLFRCVGLTGFEPATP